MNNVMNEITSGTTPKYKNIGSILFPIHTTPKDFLHYLLSVILHFFLLFYNNSVKWYLSKKRVQFILSNWTHLFSIIYLNDCYRIGKGHYRIRKALL